MFISQLKERGSDKQGSGWFKAPRGRRVHAGTDRACENGTVIHCEIPGRVVKVGWAYSDPKKSHLRYVAIQYSEKWFYRVFYVNPIVKLGQYVEKNDIIGTSLNLGKFYPGITEHVHFEAYTLKDFNKSEHDKRNFQYINPNAILEALK
jgi:murein DD-endopeptidase MepM/ murein hydrolase activator NlpD